MYPNTFFRYLATGRRQPLAFAIERGSGGTSVTAIDAETKNRIAGQVPAPAPGTAGTATKLVTALIKVFGTTLGGEEVESAEYQLPIRVCNGCLVAFTADCTNATIDSGGQTALPCRIGQDEVVPCNLCQDKPVCQQPAP